MLRCNRDPRSKEAIQPLLTILTVRDELLADGIRRMLATHLEGPAIVIVGRAHVGGVVERLVEHGFRLTGEGVQRNVAVACPATWPDARAEGGIRRERERNPISRTESRPSHQGRRMDIFRRPGGQR